jgi:hypothetical protein
MPLSFRGQNDVEENTCGAAMCSGESLQRRQLYLGEVIDGKMYVRFK